MIPVSSSVFVSTFPIALFAAEVTPESFPKICPNLSASFSVLTRACANRSLLSTRSIFGSLLNLFLFHTIVFSSNPGFLRITLAFESLSSLILTGPQFRNSTSVLDQVLVYHWQLEAGDFGGPLTPLVQGGSHAALLLGAGDVDFLPIL